MLLTSDSPQIGSADVPQQVDLRAELKAARAETDRLFTLIDAKDIYVRPLPQRHRLIFYLGHLEAFDWNQLGRATLHRGHVHPTFDQLFERGIDPEPGQLPADQPADWPSLIETQSYIANVRERIDLLWDEAPAHIQQTAIEHRWMHAETLAYLLHNLPVEQKRRPGSVVLPTSANDPVIQQFLAIPAGCATLGRDRDSGFGWDNEFPLTRADVPAFSISKYKVTNGEYLEFVNEGNPAPHFWVQQNDVWFYRGMFELVKLPLDAPVYVTQEQATAYAESRGFSLPTEEQFHRAAFGTAHGHDERERSQVHGNFDFRHWDPVSVLEDPEDASAFGVHQLIGNGWEWTRTPFAPFPGFQAEAHYPGYSADFFDGKHFVLKGASPRTAALLTRRSLRNWFRPDYPYLYATFRLVKN